MTTKVARGYRLQVHCAIVPLCQIKVLLWPNPKLLSRGEDRSPLKYIISVLLSDSKYFIEKKFGLSTRVWISILGGPKLLLRGQTLGAKSAKKCCHVGILEAFHLWSLAISVKAQRSTFQLSTNHVVGLPSPLK